MASAYKSALRADADSDESMTDASLSSAEISQDESAGEDGIEDEKNVVEKVVKSAKSAKSTTDSTHLPELRNRILMLTSRGVTFRHRHLLTDLCGLLPHTYKASKLETKKNNNYNAALNGLADLHSCNYVFFFEGRKRGQDLYAWMAAAPNGPTIKAHVTNVHTMSELGFGGNVLKGGRGVVVFDKSFDEGQAPGGEYRELVRELLRGVFCVPQKIRGVKPFIDRVISVHNLDGKIWLRVYEIREGEKSEGASQDRTPSSDISLVEVGPRMVLNVITILEGSFGGPVLYSNRQFVSPNVIRREARESKAATYAQRRATTDERKIKRKTLGMENGMQPKSFLDDSILFR